MANVGNIDSVVRLFLAIGFLALSVGGVFSGILGIVGVVWAVYLLVTSFSGFSPLYYFLKFSSERQEV